MFSQLFLRAFNALRVLIVHFIMKIFTAVHALGQYIIETLRSDSTEVKPEKSAPRFIGDYRSLDADSSDQPVRAFPIPVGYLIIWV